MVSTRMTPPATESPPHKERRQKRIPICSRSRATSPKRSGMAWRQNHYSARMAGQHILEGQQQQPFFFVDGAAADDDRPGSRLLERRAQAGNDGRRSRGLNVIFQISGDT